MADVTKTWDNSFRLDSYLVAGSQQIPVGSAMVGRIASATCIRNRPRPSDLSPTPMFIRRTWANPQVYERDAGFAKYIGSITFVHGGVSAKTKRVIPSVSGGQIAKLDALARLGRGSMNLAQTLAEARETYGTIATNLYRLGTFALALKKGNFRRAAEVLDIRLSRRGEARLKQQSWLERVSSGWLEYSYGILPIIGDVEGAIQHMDDKFHEGASRSAYGGMSRAQREALSSFADVHKWAAENSTEVSDPRVTYRGVIDNSNLRRAQELGFINIPALAWELVPLSFVFDWFGTIGAYMDTLTHGAGLKFVWGCTTNYSSTTVFAPGVGYVTRTEDIVRMPTSPTIEFSPFLLRNSPLKGSQIASLAALTKQRLFQRL